MPEGGTSRTRCASRILAAFSIEGLVIWASGGGSVPEYRRGAPVIVICDTSATKNITRTGDEVAQSYIEGLLSGGEVVLIDTRQHWVAALRYALKPIVLVGGIVLLAILNNILDFDGALNFINQLVSWILIIMVIVAVVWLPINLVQWYSRKYVLTNRRAMRMSGVLRKTSFDSSLEQINDIAMDQSFFGRQMGYADLTLYTASDTANEQYKQLMDGLQFKKAVLDAKEGIRHGHPLTELPAGFIVKGGTNEASMRADGKIQEAAAKTQATPATSEPNTLSSAAAVTEEPDVADPDPVVVEPEPVSAAEPEPESSTDVEGDKPA
jgi:membrane protein YdbS with pleckstrin-like domain